MGWPRCELCDCAALKSARAGSQQKVPRWALRKEAAAAPRRSEFVLALRFFVFKIKFLKETSSSKSVLQCTRTMNSPTSAWPLSGWRKDLIKYLEAIE